MEEEKQAKPTVPFHLFLTSRFDLFGFFYLFLISLCHKPQIRAVVTIARK